ncbi:MAG: hypothetical protein IT342_16615 [Candidatus Melainabacteria bacterium]|nr:hypothetical protein [Candidatus Melainabacteria bacterium]
MSQHNRKSNDDQMRQAKKEAINALYFAVVEAIESAQEAHDAPIEVPVSGISLDVVNTVIARFENSGWNVELTADAQTLSATFANIDNTHTPKPPRPPYTPPTPGIPNPPVQPIFEPGGKPVPQPPMPPGLSPDPIPTRPDEK